MYSADVKGQLFSAALPLKPLTTWAGSACTVTIAVPDAPALAGLTVSAVTVTLSLPDCQTVSCAATRAEGSPLYVATFAASAFATSGFVSNGLMISFSGLDETGTARVWIIAKGDIEVLSGDASPTPGESYYAVKLRAAAPEDPVEGDTYISAGKLNIYHGGEWVTIGADAVVIDETIDAESTNPVRNAAIAAALLLKADATALANKADKTELPYALVEPGVWKFSPSSYDGREFSIVEQAGSEVGTESYLLFLGDETVGGIIDGEPNELGLVFIAELVDDPGNPFTVTATRASLPGHLLDRAGNRVVVTDDTTLTLPAAVPGYLRDFLVRLEISGSTVPTITFAAPTGETITYETDGDEFPVPDEVGTWSYSFTENCKAHTFAVSLKKVNEVAAPQAQGGA